MSMARRDGDARYLWCIAAAIGITISACGWFALVHSDLGIDLLDYFLEAMSLLFLPGILMSALLCGSVHNESLGLAFVLNSLLYSLCLYRVLRIVIVRTTARRESGQTTPRDFSE